MKLTCDLCGNILTEIDNNHAICNQCGMEYGSDRLRELRGAIPPSDVPPAPEPPTFVPPTSQAPSAEPEPQQKKSGCGVWFWIIVAILDLLVGTHGIVAVFCLIIAFVVSRSSRKK